MNLSFAHIQHSLKHHPTIKQEEPRELKARASVAVVLAGEDGDPYVSLIRRAERASDRWSGHMSFPGGRRSEEDADVIATAMRETQEEVGMRLERAHYIGQLDELELLNHGSARQAVLSSCVFMMPGERPKLTADPGEVAETYWIAIRDLYDPEVLTSYKWTHPDTGEAMEFPGLLHKGQIIWGLTYRVLGQLGEVLNWKLPGS